MVMMVALQRVETAIQAQSHYGLAQTGKVFGFLRLALELGCWLQFFNLEIISKFNGKVIMSTP